MTQPPPYDLAKPTAVEPSWREPADEGDSDVLPFEDAAERAVPAPALPVERYWTESRILRLGSMLLFVLASSVAIVKIGLAFPDVAWLPYLVAAIVYGLLMFHELQAHHAAEEGARMRRERAEREPKFRMSGQ